MFAYFSSFKISQNDVLIGITSYGMKLTQVTNAGISRDVICQAIAENVVVTTQSRANTRLALNNAREILTTFGRTQARKRVLLITDEMLINTAEALNQANQIKALGAMITVIGT